MSVGVATETQSRARNDPPNQIQHPEEVWRT